MPNTFSYVDEPWPLLICISITGRKRKHEELFAPDPVKDAPQYISTNTTLATCKANGLRGIYNAGATCYQNVVLQSFLHNPILRNFYLSDGHQSGSCDTPHCLSCAMDDMFQEFYASETTNGYTAANILSGFWISENKAFENLVANKEQDAHEFFQFMAEELHERNGDGKRPEIGSEHTCNCIIHQTYYGKLQTSTTCQNCGGVTNQAQSFLDLSVPLENLTQKRGKKNFSNGDGVASTRTQNSVTLQECLDEEYIKSDKCEYRCQNCNSVQQARRQTSIKKLPNVLSIQLKVRLPGVLPHAHSLLAVTAGLAGRQQKLTVANRGSSSNKGVMIVPRRSRHLSSFLYNSTCCLIRHAHEHRISKITTSYSGPALMIFFALLCTLATWIPDTTFLIAGLATR